MNVSGWWTILSFIFAPAQEMELQLQVTRPTFLTKSESQSMLIDCIEIADRRILRQKNGERIGRVRRFKFQTKQDQLGLSWLQRAEKQKKMFLLLQRKNKNNSKKHTFVLTL